MRLCEALDIPRGLTAVVGGGGKTTLIERLAHELSENARVLLATTTKIWPPACQTLLSPTRAQVVEAFQTSRLLAVGDPTPEGKLTAVAALDGHFSGLADYVLVEADGSRGLPLKAPEAQEPALPAGASLTLAVAGMSCAGLTIDQAAHRAARYAALLGVPQNAPVTPEGVARVLSHPLGQRKGVVGRFAVVLNQADTPQRIAFARAVAACLAEEAFLVALREKPDFCERWQNGAQVAKEEPTRANGAADSPGR